MRWLDVDLEFVCFYRSSLEKQIRYMKYVYCMDKNDYCIPQGSRMNGITRIFVKKAIEYGKEVYYDNNCILRSFIDK